MKSESVSEEIDQMIADVGLPHKRTALAKDLSGISEVLLFIFSCKISVKETAEIFLTLTREVFVIFLLLLLLLLHGLNTL